MTTENLTNNSIRQYIPNILTEVDGETPLADKLAPFIDSAKLWLESEYIGSEDFLSKAHNDFALKILVAKAFADAVPSLDLIVTPSGMAVVNTDNMVPASKERVERLVSSLRDYVRTNVCLLIDICRSYEVWRQSERGQYFCSSFLNSPSICVDELKNLSYDEVRSRAVVAESKLANLYLGHNLMTKLRNDFNSGSIGKGHNLVSAIRAAVVALISSSSITNQNKLWHIAAPIVNELNYYPEYKELWNNEMGDKFNVSAFVNNIKGGFYF